MNLTTVKSKKIRWLYTYIIYTNCTFWGLQFSYFGLVSLMVGGMDTIGTDVIYVCTCLLLYLSPQTWDHSWLATFHSLLLHPPGFRFIKLKLGI